MCNVTYAGKSDKHGRTQELFMVLLSSSSFPGLLVNKGFTTMVVAPWHQYIWISAASSDKHINSLCESLKIINEQAALAAGDLLRTSYSVCHRMSRQHFAYCSTNYTYALWV